MIGYKEMYTPIEGLPLLAPEETRQYGILNEPLGVFKTEKQVIKWSPERKRSEYIALTDDLIGKMDGTIPLKNERVYRATTEGFREEKRDLAKPEAVIYLDKSARPIRWLVHALWPVLAREPGTDFDEKQIPPEPESYFLNIDKRDWLVLMGVPEYDLESVTSNAIDFSKIDRKHFARIRALFSTNKQITEENVDQAWNFPTTLDGKHIMIVDEVKSSGRSLEIAQKLLSLAIPEAVVSGQHWATPMMVPLNNGVDYGQGVQKKMSWVPDWYDAKNEEGRGVYDRNEEWPELQLAGGKAPSRITSIGKYVLSTHPHKQASVARKIDERAKILRQDIEKLAYDMEHHPGKELYRPGSDRRSSDDNLVDRIEKLNQMSYGDWCNKRDELLREN